MNEEIAKLEAKSLAEAVKGGGPLESDEVVRILSTRSKLHLNSVYNHYNQITANSLDQVLHLIDLIILSSITSQRNIIIDPF